jgi:hypothetical protein
MPPRHFGTHGDLEGKAAGVGQAQGQHDRFADFVSLFVERQVKRRRQDFLLRDRPSRREKRQGDQCCQGQTSQHQRLPSSFCEHLFDRHSHLYDGRPESADCPGPNAPVHPPGPLLRRGVARKKNAAPVVVYRWVRRLLAHQNRHHGFFGRVTLLPLDLPLPNSSVIPVTIALWQTNNFSAGRPNADASDFAQPQFFMSSSS